MRLGLALACLAIAGAPAASAATYTLAAQSANPAAFGGFSLTFDDLDDDTLFSLNELLSFSGVEDFVEGRIYDLLFAVPDIAGLTDGGDPFWRFVETSTGFAFTASTTGFAYERTRLSPPPAVPAPAAGLVLAGALAALALIRQRRPAQKAWMRLQASSSCASDVA
jgi:hypothetical protein